MRTDRRSSRSRRRIKCGNDSVTQTQTISSNVAALDANEAAAPVTLSFNTAAFTVNAAGVAIVALHNGPCTVSAERDDDRRAERDEQHARSR